MHWSGGRRAHRDLDLAVDARDEPTALLLLENRGYQVQTDWRPVRVELVRAGEAWVDLHPVVFDQAGHGRQAALGGDQFDYPRESFGTGCWGATRVPCLSPVQQLKFHSGYDPRPVDLHDVRLIHAGTPAFQPARSAERSRIDHGSESS